MKLFRLFNKRENPKQFVVLPPRGQDKGGVIDTSEIDWNIIGRDNRRMKFVIPISANADSKQALDQLMAMWKEKFDTDVDITEED